MALILFALFVAVPLLEIAAFIKIGEAIGVVPTLLGCVVTAIIGAFLVRLQGFGVLRAAQAAMARQELPVDQLIEGVMILAAGILLMTPGYVTDMAGFLLLVPPVRAALARLVRDWARDRAVVIATGGRGAQTGPGTTIEGEAEDITDKTGGRQQ
ncbi:MAG: FxsA family protein [Parvularculaceae bacterium]|nr:FxsA family protein [Parvularculaceae bacterium]